MAEVPLYRRDEVVGVALVDDDDLSLVSQHRWYLDVTTGYATTNILDERGGLRSDGVRQRRRVLRMHRLLLGLRVGDGLLCDHINRDKLDNRRANLRVVTRGQNNQNIDPRLRGGSRYRGVAWDRFTNKWLATASSKYVGRFDTEEEAAEAARRAREERMTHATD